MKKLDLTQLPLAELFDALDDAVVWVKDIAGRYRWVNRAFLLNYASGIGSVGENPAPVLGKTDYDLSPAFVADQFRLDDEQVLSGRRIVNRIELVSEADGTASWHVTNKIPLRDATGKVVGTAGISRPLPTANPDSGDGFGPVLAHFASHYQAPVTNRELAQLMHMSVRAFERKFARTFHLTPQKYLRKLRMRLASRALVYSDRPLVEVAMSCGFADQSHFTREFRRHFGRTPREHRAHYAAFGIKTGASTQ